MSVKGHKHVGADCVKVAVKALTLIIHLLAFSSGVS